MCLAAVNFKIMYLAAVSCRGTHKIPRSASQRFSHFPIKGTKVICKKKSAEAYSTAASRDKLKKNKRSNIFLSVEEKSSLSRMTREEVNCE